MVGNLFIFEHFSGRWKGELPRSKDNKYIVIIR
jgi:hypothetical protein